MACMLEIHSIFIVAQLKLQLEIFQTLFDLGSQKFIYKPYP